MTRAIRKMHGMSGTPAHRAWKWMRNRCLNPNAARYAYYGGRGITICDRWNTFENFLEDMGQPPPGHSLDRINGDGPYSKENCRWADKATQSRNREYCVKLTINGVTKTRAEWMREVGLGSTHYYRLKARGMSSVEVIEYYRDRKRAQ